MALIRPALRDDARAVARVHEHARAAYYRLAPPEDVDPERMEMWWSAIAEHRRATVLVAEDDEEIVGLISFGPPIHEWALPGPVVELQALYVLPDHWGRGIGSALHQRFVKRLPGGRTGILDIWERNDRAIGFYERRGWRRDGRSRPGPEGSVYVGMSLALGR